MTGTQKNLVFPALTPSCPSYPDALIASCPSHSSLWGQSELVGILQGQMGRRAQGWEGTRAGGIEGWEHSRVGEHKGEGAQGQEGTGLGGCKGRRAQGQEHARKRGHKGRSVQGWGQKGSRVEGQKGARLSIRVYGRGAIRAGRYKIGGKMVEGLKGARERGHKGRKV